MPCCIVFVVLVELTIDLTLWSECNGAGCIHTCALRRKTFHRLLLSDGPTKWLLIKVSRDGHALTYPSSMNAIGRRESSMQPQLADPQYSLCFALTVKLLLFCKHGVQSWSMTKFFGDMD